MTTTRAKHPARILFVDDQKDLRDLYTNMLARQGHEVTMAADGATALDLAVKRELDVAFVDMLLPGMSGFAVLTELHKKRKSLPIVMMSGSPNEEVRTGSMLLGAFAFLAKPFEPRAVELLIARALARARPA